MKQYFAVIDTNVLVSALLTSNTDSPTVKIIEKIFRNEVVPIYNDNIISEYYEVLCRKKFGLSHGNIETLLSAIVKLGIEATDHKSNALLLDESDRPFLDAFESFPDKSIFLITGNIKHFPCSNLIISPREFLNLIESSEQ